jgi:uncharacterized OB-fold protein
MTVQNLSVPAFWRRRLSLYKLRAVRCKRCGRIHYPPGAACPHCGSRDLEPVDLDKPGILESFTIIYSVPTRSKNRAPVVLGVVNVDGVRIVSELTDVDPDELKVGIKVEPVLRRVDHDGDTGIIRYALKFRPILVSQSDQR